MKSSAFLLWAGWIASTAACGRLLSGAGAGDLGSDGAVVRATPDGPAVDGADASVADAGAADGDAWALEAEADETAETSSDAPLPGCIDDDGGLLPGNPASGTLVGDNVLAAVCLGGAFAYLEKPAYSTSPYIFIANTAGSGTTTEFQRPADALFGEITVLTGVSAASPGTYGSDSSCGSVVVCVGLPTPPIDCGDSSFTCPAGCGLFGPVSNPMCQPVEPTDCWTAYTGALCVPGGHPQTPGGSWSLTLTSVDSPGADVGIDARLNVHGSLTATLLGNGDAGLGPATLTLSF
jgi:hypothetical protein